MLTLALIGRPNVGKSTLFNRLVGKDLAIVDDRPGVTRDWRMAEAYLFDRLVRVMDTAGLEEAEAGSLTDRMRQQTEEALSMAHIVLFVIDGVTGVTPVDESFARLVRRSGKPVLLVVNKGDTKKARSAVHEAYTLGLGDPYLVSGAHGEGLAPLYHAIFEQAEICLPSAPDGEAGTSTETDDRMGDDLPALPDIDALEGLEDFTFEDADDTGKDPQKPIKIAIIGRPNAGKSTLLNQILGHERALTGPEAGITRDPVSADWSWNGQSYQIVDTAGLRRRARVTDKVEQLSTRETMRAVRLAQIVILVVDGLQGLERQDLTIADHVVREGRALILAINKWDAIDDKAGITSQLRSMLDQVLGQLPGIPVVYISGLTGQRLPTLYNTIESTYKAWSSRVGTGALNRWLGKTESRHPAPLVNGRPNRLRYMTQIKSRPPTFALWVGRPDDMPDDYQRYLINGLREQFNLGGIPIRLYLRSSKNPYAN